MSDYKVVLLKGGVTLDHCTTHRLDKIEPDKFSMICWCICIMNIVINDVQFSNACELISKGQQYPRSDR